MDEDFKNMNSPNEIYDDPKNNPNPNYINPQMTNEGYFNSQSNIYSPLHSNNTPQANTYSQISGNIYYQNNININTQPQNNNIYNNQFNENYYPPPTIYSSESNGYFNPGYTPNTNETNQIYNPNITDDTSPVNSPQIISDNNNEFKTKTNNGIILSTKINITPVNIDDNSLPNTLEPIVNIPTNKANNVKNCCSRRDPSLLEVTGRQKGLIITLCIFVDILGFNEIVLASKIDSIYYDLVILNNIINIPFSIMESVSILKIKCIRIFGSALSAVYLLGNIIVFIIQLRKIKNNEELEDKEKISGYKVINILKITLLVAIMNIVFYAYWRIRICSKRRRRDC